MTTRDDPDRVSPRLDRLMTAWFDAESSFSAPSDLLDRTLARTEPARPRPAWLLPERWIPMELTMRRGSIPNAARYAALLLIIVLLIVAALAITGSERRVPAPFGPAVNGVLVIKTPGGDIATVDPTSGLTTTIVGGPELDQVPMFSRDGTRIAFVRSVPGGFDVFIADASGRGPVRLTDRPLDEVPNMYWSPDGSRLAFFVWGSGLMIAKTDGTGMNRVDLGDISGVVDLAWRPPDGRQVVFAGSQDGALRLFLMDPDGSGLKRISTYDGGKDDFQWLSLAPDGNHAAYGAFPAKRIHIVTIDEGRDDVVVPDAGIGLNFPRWSPDGSRIAVLQVPDGALPSTRVAVFDARELSPHLTLTGPTFVGGVQFDWSPDGTAILANQWGGDETWLLDPAGGPATHNSWRAEFPAFVEWQRLAG